MTYQINITSYFLCFSLVIKTHFQKTQIELKITLNVYLRLLSQFLRLSMYLPIYLPSSEPVAVFIFAFFNT